MQIGAGFASVAARGGQTAAVKTDGTLWTWGNNELGQLGDGTTTNRHAPVQIGTGYASVSVGQGHMAAIAAGAVWAWGGNSGGQVGDGTSTDRTAPSLIR